MTLILAKNYQQRKNDKIIIKVVNDPEEMIYVFQ